MAAVILGVLTGCGGGSKTTAPISGTGGAGGEGNPTGANRLFNIAEAYDPKTDSWTALAPLKVARHGLGAASIGDKLYVAGGSTAMAGGSPTDVVEELTL